MPEGASASSGDQPALDVAVGWLDRHLDLLLPDTDSAAFDRDLLQRTGEFAILYRGLVNSDESSRYEAAWRHRLSSYIQSQYLIDMARKSLQTSWAWLMPYMVFKQTHGLVIPEHDATMQAARSAGLPYSIETVPYRRVDQNYFLFMDTSTAPDFTEQVRDTFLSRCANLLWIDRDSAYSFTHTLFYANDFGSKMMHSDHPAHSKVVAILSSLLPQFARTEDWDILGELLVVALRTEGIESALVAEYLELFRSQRNGSGFTPPSRLTSEALEDRTDTESVFEACYHTTLVAALLEITVRSDPTIPVQSFLLAETHLGGKEPSQMMSRILDARNRAVEFLNSQDKIGNQVRVIEQNSSTMDLEARDRPVLAGLDRDIILASLASESPEPVSRYAIELAECFAREGDIEVVLRLIQSRSERDRTEPRLAALWSFALNQQRPDGAVGYFAHEARALGSPDLGAIRLWLTHVFVESADSWIDKDK